MSASFHPATGGASSPNADTETEMMARPVGVYVSPEPAQPEGHQLAVVTSPASAAGTGDGTAAPMERNQVIIHATPSNSQQVVSQGDGGLASARSQSLADPPAQEYVYGEDEDEEDAPQPPVLDPAMPRTLVPITAPFPIDQTQTQDGAHLAMPMSAGDEPRPSPFSVEHRVTYDENGNEIREKVIRLGEDPLPVQYNHIRYDPASETDNGNASTVITVPVKPDGTMSRAPRDDRDGSTISWAYGWYFTAAMLLAWLALFLIEFGTDSWALEDTYINPSLGPSYHSLDRLGGKNTYKILGRAHAHWGSASTETYRIITPIFWHSGIIHFVPDMFALLWLGMVIEREYGPIRVAIIFFVSGFFGTLFSSVFLVDALTVSASACVFGLIGAHFVGTILYRSWYTRRHVLLTLFSLTFLALCGLIIGLLPLIDNWSHIGGLVMGGLLAGVLFTGGWRPAPDEQLEYVNIRTEDEAATKRYLKTRVVSLALAVALFVVTIVMLFVVVRNDMRDNPYPRKDDNWCTSCFKFNCVDTPSWSCKPSIYYY